MASSRQAAVVFCLCLLLRWPAQPGTASALSDAASTGGEVSGQYILLETTSTDRTRGAPMHMLQAEDGQTFRLNFTAGLPRPGLQPSSHIRVHYSGSDPHGGTLRVAEQPTVLRGARSLLGSGGMATPPAPAFLVFVIDSICGRGDGPAATAAEVRALFTGGETNMAGYFSTCSMNRVNINPSVAVVTGIRLCAGTVPDTYDSFTVDTCRGPNMPRWMAKVLADARAGGMNVDQYHHSIMILPRGFTKYVSDCNWAGVGSTGPTVPPFQTMTSGNSWGTAFVWWAGDNFGDQQILFHELGHNYGLYHASAPPALMPGCTGDTCDNTCAMGGVGGQGVRCLNAPHSYQLGWAWDLVELQDPDLPAGHTELVAIPAQLSKQASMVRLVLGPLGSTVLYLSARRNAAPYDLPFEAGPRATRPFVLVHAWNGAQDDTGHVTDLRAAVGVNSTWLEAATSIVVRFVAWDGAAATVAVCRRRSAVETLCGNNQDDDCDGLVDWADPDCAKALPPPPRPPPRSSIDFGQSAPRRPSPPPRPLPLSRPPPPPPLLRSMGSRPPPDAAPPPPPLLPPPGRPVARIRPPPRAPRSPRPSPPQPSLLLETAITPPPSSPPRRPRKSRPPPEPHTPRRPHLPKEPDEPAAPPLSPPPPPPPLSPPPLPPSPPPTLPLLPPPTLPSPPPPLEPFPPPPEPEPSPALQAGQGQDAQPPTAPPPEQPAGGPAQAVRHRRRRLTQQLSGSGVAIVARAGGRRRLRDLSSADGEARTRR